MLVFRHQLVPVKDQPGRCEPLHPFEPVTLDSLQPGDTSLTSDLDTVDLLEMGDLAFLLKYASDVHAELTRTAFHEGLSGQVVLYDHDHCRFPATCGAYAPVRLPSNCEKGWLHSSQLAGNLPFMSLDTALDFLGEDGSSHTLLAEIIRRGIDRKDSALIHNSMELFIPKAVEGRFVIFIRARGNQSQGKRASVA